MKLLRVLLYGLDRLNRVLEHSSPMTQLRMRKVMRMTRTASKIRAVTRKPKSLATKAAVALGASVAGWAVRKVIRAVR